MDVDDGSGPEFLESEGPGEDHGWTQMGPWEELIVPNAVVVGDAMDAAADLRVLLLQVSTQELLLTSTRMGARRKKEKMGTAESLP